MGQQGKNKTSPSDDLLHFQAHAETIYRMAIENADGVPYQRDLITDKYVFVGPGVQALLGIRPEEFTLERLQELTQEHILTDRAEPVERLAYFAAFSRGEIPRYRADLRIHTPDGRTKWISDCAIPLRNGQSGKVVGAVGILLDITDRKQAELKLRESEARYRTLVEQIPAVAYTATLDEPVTTTYASPHIGRLLGYPSTEHQNDPNFWRQWLHPEDRERALAEVARCRASGERVVIEYRMLTRDDRVVWFHDEAEIVRDEAGRPLHFQGVMVEITARKQAEIQNEILGRMATRLAASADVENMIHAVQEGTSQLLAWDAHYFTVRRPGEDDFHTLH
ncbi:MAG TPA: PAS domain-containing protein, partial [Phycisphaerae bacterium]|nr:PAS domain-containing protein [Phycisphaerae bacterium]